MGSREHAEEKLAPITVGSILENVNSLDLEVGEFQDLIKSMPESANLDIPILETLAQKYLRAADRCSEILSNLTLKEARCKSNKEKIKSQLFLKANEFGYSTAKDKEAFAMSHEDYLSADDEYQTSKVVTAFFEHKHKWFLSAHHLMKDRLKGEQRHQKASGFSETIGKQTGEVEW
jgi:hypothetical protein